MYSDEQSRINAVTSYFFLGPIFLLAKKGTPLGDPYVRDHAKKSSIITGVMFLEFLVYFLMRPYITWSIPGIGLDIRTILLIVIVGFTMISLMKGAYRAYHGGSADEVSLTHIDHLSSFTDISGVYAVEKDEEKTRILASMIPFFGIIISSRFDHPLIARARIIGSMGAFFYIVALIFSGNVGFLSFVILTLGILLFVVEAVYLTLYGRWVSWGILDKIPSYREIEISILAGIVSIKDFLLISFGKEKTTTYTDRYRAILESKKTSHENTPTYFMPAGLLGVPFWNLFGIPSFFIEKYRAYRSVVLEGLTITIIIVYFWLYRGEWTSPWLLLLLFPMFHIFAYAGKDCSDRSPGIGLIILLFELLGSKAKGSKTITEQKYTYEVTPESPTSEIPKP